MNDMDLTILLLYLHTILLHVTFWENLTTGTENVAQALFLCSPLSSRPTDRSVCATFQSPIVPSSIAHCTLFNQPLYPL